MIGRRVLLLAPAIAVGVGGVAFWAMLRGAQEGTFMPRDVPNPLIGKPAPATTLAPLLDGPGISQPDLATGQPLLVNFFASWCQPCQIEHPQLMALAKEIPVWGIAYKDKPDAARSFLTRFGNPFARTAIDLPGLAGIEWGITGVPETFLLDGAGTVRWRYAGPLLKDVVAERLRPALRSLVAA